MSDFNISIFIFTSTYLAIVSEKLSRTVCALVGGGLMIYAGILSQDSAIKHFVDFNTLGLLAGMMILISIVRDTGFFEAMALWAVKKSKGKGKELLILLALITGIGAALIDSVTAALLMAPMTLSICRMIRCSPMPFLITEVLLANIGGTALMIGNPPNVMIGSASKLDFNSFLINLAPIVIIVSAVTVITVLFIYRSKLHSNALSDQEIARIRISSAIRDKKALQKALTVLFLTIVGFVIHGHFGLQSATVAMTGAIVAIIVCGINAEEAFKSIELDTLLFFMGLFILVGGLEKTGVIKMIAEQGIKLVDGDVKILTFLILVLSGVASAFVDNIPFTATMIPLIQDIQQMLGVHAEHLWWSLALGACFGGNGTLIGASPNVIIMAEAEKEGYKVSFLQFFMICFPIMLLSLLISSIYIYLRYF